jgi:hypothetical protein
MLFKLLKLFGLDVAAKIDAAKSGLEQRVQRTTDHIKDVAEGAAVIAVLGLIASVTATMALVVGLIAAYRFTAQAYGEYAGLGTDAAILIVMTAVFAAVIFAKARKLSSASTATHVAGAPPASTIRQQAESSAVEPTPATTMVSQPNDYLLPIRSSASPRDLIDPLALLLSEVVQVPELGNPIVDRMIGTIRTTARGSADEAVYRAADVIRHGRGADIIFVLAGTVALAWLVTRNARPRA